MSPAGTQDHGVPQRGSAPPQHASPADALPAERGFEAGRAGPDECLRRCGESLGMHYALAAAMRAAGAGLIVVATPSCLCAQHRGGMGDAPWIQSLFGNAAAIGAGIAAALRVRGHRPARVVAQGDSGSTAAVGLACLVDVFERNDDVLFLCYDDDGCPLAGEGRAHLPGPALHSGIDAFASPLMGMGRSLPLVALAHGIPYAATASVADRRDLEVKVVRAIGISGARYVQIHAPCPVGCGTTPETALRVAELAVDAGLFPLFEAEHGIITTRFEPPRRIPVRDYLEPQPRFAHLLEGDAQTAALARLQALADRNITRFGLGYCSS